MRCVQRGRLAANATPAALQLPVLVVLVALVAVISGCATHSARLSAASPSPISAGDRNWLNNVHQADLAEIEAGQLAKAKGTSPAVRSAGAMLAGDHTAFDAKLVRAAAALKVKLPDYLTNQQALARERLGSETGQQFDHDFTATMLTGHQYAISLTENEISHGSAPEVTGLARQALPTLRKHLAMLQKASPAG